MSIPTTITDLTYEELLYLQRISNRGASEGLCYFWYNLKRGNYKSIPMALERDVADMKSKYPDFVREINIWLTYGKI